MYYVLALSTLAALSVTTHFVLDSLNHAMESDGKVINVAGLQRSLNLRASRDALQVLAATTAQDDAALADAREALRSTLDKWLADHEALLARDPAAGLGGENSPAIHRQLETIVADINQVRERAERLLGAETAQESDALVTEIVSLNNAMFPLEDAVVSAYEVDLERRVSSLQSAETTAYLASLAILCVVAFFMFEPAIRRINQQRDELDTLQATIDEHTIYAEFDLNGHIVEVNEGFCRISGYARDELIDQPVALLDSGTHPDSFLKEMQDTVASGRAWRGQLCESASDGSLYWVDATNVPQVGADGAVQRYVSWRFDITERKRAEAEALKAEERLELAMFNSNTGLWDWDAVTGAVYFSETWYTMLGYEPGELPAQIETWAMLVHPDDLSDAQAELERHFRGESPVYRKLHRLKRKDGGWHWIRGVGRVVERNDDGSPKRLVGVNIDEQALNEALENAEQERERSRMAEQRLALALSSSSTGLWDIDLETGDTYFNDIWYTMLGYQPGELPMSGETWQRILHADDRETAKKAFKDHVAGEAPDYRINVRVRRKEGIWQWIRSIGQIVERTEAGMPKRMVGVHTDIQALRDAIGKAESSNEELKATQQRFELALAGSRDAIFDWNLETRNLFLSERWRELLDNPELVLDSEKSSLLAHVSSQDLARVEGALNAFLQSDASEFEAEFKLDSAGGRTPSVLMRAAAVRNKDGQATRLAGSLADLTSIKAAEEELHRLVQTDHLTGLASRNRLMDELTGAVARSKRNGKLCAVLFFDFDRFKVVNDSLGHDVGDELLCSIADRLRSSTRETDTVARFGGDEFVILLENLASDDDAAQVAEKLLHVCADPHEIRSHRLVSTASIGMMVNRNAALSPTEMLRNADAAMYEAKRRGRGCVVEFDEQMFNEQLEKLSLEEDLKLAIERNELKLEYQPIIDLTNGQTVSAEALLRWNRPGTGLVPPDEFIPVAEESKQIINIGSWVIAEACEQLAEWRQSSSVSESFSISVNVSRSQLLNPGFTTAFVRQLDRYGLPRSAVKIEVTETTIVDNRSDIGQVLQDLRDHSIVVMMDDFGTGHSSLSGLHALPIDELKIDRSFIQNVSNNTDMVAITGSIITLADHLSLSTIGEGIESMEHVVSLQSMGCTFGQGYFWSPPLPPDELVDFISGGSKAKKSA